MSKVYIGWYSIVDLGEYDWIDNDYDKHMYLIYDANGNLADSNDQQIIRGGDNNLSMAAMAENIANGTYLDFAGPLATESSISSQNSVDGLNNIADDDSDGFLNNDLDRDGIADTTTERYYTEVDLAPAIALPEYNTVEDVWAAMTALAADLDSSDYAYRLWSWNCQATVVSALSAVGVDFEENVPTGSSFNQWISRDVIINGDGNFKQFGWGGKDWFYDTGGNDIFHGGDGTVLNAADVSDGIDTISYEGENEITFWYENLGSGNSAWKASQINGSVSKVDTLYSIETFYESTSAQNTLFDFSNYTTNVTISDEQEENFEDYQDFEEDVISSVMTMQITGGNLSFVNIYDFIGSAYGDTFSLNAVLGRAFDGNGGGDLISYEDIADEDGITIRLNDETAFITGTDLVAGPGGGPFDEVVNIENAKGSDFGDEITGSTGSNYLYGEAGNDRFFATTGADDLYGGEGTDVADYEQIGAFLKVLSVPLEQGNYTVDKYFNQTSATGTYERDNLYSIEDILGDVDNGISIDGAGGKLVKGDEEDNTVQLPYQVLGPATLYGYGGNDTLNGSGTATDNDYLVGGAGDDLVDGGYGDDIYVYRRGDGNDIFRENTGNSWQDTIMFQGGITLADLTFSRTTEPGAFITILGGGEIYMRSQATQATINFLKFEDGSVVDMQGVLIPVYGTNSGERLDGTTDNGSGPEGSSIHDVIYGYGGNDDLYGNDGNDHLYGGDGIDDLFGNYGGDYLYGEGGNDDLSGGADDDVLYGGEGNDLLRGGDGNDLYDGGAGNDTMNESTSSGNDIYVFSGGLDSIYDGGYTDTLRLSGATTIGDISITDMPNNDITVVVSAGVDEILIKSFDTTTYKIENIEFGNGSWASLADHASWVRGTSGNDTLAGAGATPVIGYGGNDTLNGGSGADNMFGGNGDDVLTGGAGDDALYGDSGVDTVSYASASSAVSVNLSTTTAQNTGGAGTDTLLGFENITASAYNDTLGGDAAANTIDGGDGNDTIEGGAGNDTLMGGAGTDTVTYTTALSGVYVNLGTTTAQNTGGGGTDTLSGFEKITGSAFNDTLIGTNSANTLSGGNGDDILEGRGANDTLNGGSGLDTASYSTATGGVTVSLDITGGQNTGGAGTDTLSSMTNLIGSTHADTLSGNEDDNTIEGLAGNDMLDGDAGTDTLSYANAGSGITINLATTTAQTTGGAGTDTIANFENILGSSHNDTLTGNGSGNVMEGGAGDDTIDGAGGTDTASYKLATSAVTVSLNVTTAQSTGGAGTDTLSNIERLVGSAFNDDLSGNGSNNQIEGGLGDDVMNGRGGTDTLAYQTATVGVTVDLSLTAAQNTIGAGTDTISNFESITGSSFNDSLSGNSGTNTLKGGNGDDVLYGAEGADNLYGEAGADTFLFMAATAFGAADTVYDFALAQNDKLDIANLLIGYNPLQSAIDNFVTFAVSGANTTLSVDRDGTATTYTSQAIATLNSVTGLDADTLLTSGNLIVV